MKRIDAVALCLLLSTFPALQVLARPPKLEAPDPSRGVIGVKIKVIAPAKIGHGWADAVYFVRVVEDSDRLAAENFIPSNYSKGKNVYLLNAKPGRYVAVACMFEPAATGAHSTVVFSKADIPRTEIEVVPGGVVFMGVIEANSSSKMSESDEAQSHYLRLIAPTTAKKGFLARAFTYDYAYTATFKSLERDEAAEKGFWVDATDGHFNNEEAWWRIIAAMIDGCTSALEHTSSNCFLSARIFQAIRQYWRETKLSFAIILASISRSESLSFSRSSKIGLSR